MARPIAIGVCVFASLAIGVGQTTPTTQPPSPLSFSGLLDGYFAIDNNHPADGRAGLRSFDSRAGEPTLSMAKLALDLTPDPVGFHLEGGFGKAFDAIEAAAPGGGLKGWKQVMQAYLSIKPKSWKGLQIDAGKFNTTVSAELTDPVMNFNYSRSVLFFFAPYYHTGLRANMPVSRTVTAGLQLVEGWNGFDGKNHGVTVGVTSAWNPNPKVSLTNTLYSGPEDYFGTRTFRNFFDSALSLSPNPNTGFYVNFDYGQDRRTLLPPANYYGIGAAGRRQLNGKFAVAVRGEVYRDAGGFWTGAPRTIGEVTATAEYRPCQWLISRLEYRRDMTTAPYFSRGWDNRMVGNQSTFEVGMIAYFGPKK